MPLKESEAIVLRSFPLGEADRLVSFLSRTEGRLRGVARGARRTKSQFGSTLETLSHVRIWFYERETRDLVRISQCELVESFYAAQGDYDLSIAFALISEVVEAVLPEHEATGPGLPACAGCFPRDFGGEGNLAAACLLRSLERAARGMATGH